MANKDVYNNTLAWDVTVADTYADSDLADTATTAGPAADKAPGNKEAE